MSFSIYHSNHLDILQMIAGRIIENDPLESPFEKEYFLVQNFGMAKWMQVTLAKQLGIVAQCEFLLPAKMLHNLLDLLFEGEELNFQSFNQEELFWPLMRIIKSLPNDEIFAPLHRYLTPKEKEQLTDKEYQKESLHLLRELTQRVAQLFDQYVVHRPDWILAWENNQLIEGLPDHQLWQKALWQKLSAYYQHPHHFGNIQTLITERLKDPHIQKLLPKRLFIIGLTSLPPLFLELLTLFSPYLDLHLFFNNPSQYYWGDIYQTEEKITARRINLETKEVRKDLHSPHLPQTLTEDESDYWQDHYGHPLLASLGKVGRDHLKILAQYEHQEFEAFTPPDGSTLLGRLQKSIFNLTPIQKEQEEPLLKLAPDDYSIIIHNHYTPTREIEALYDQLLHRLNEDPTLTPKDIVVMSPNIERYAPIIKAVFDNQPKERAIPYSISDISLVEEEPQLNALIQLLQLPESYFKANELLTLLQVPEILSKFNISPDQLQLINHWIMDVNIHLGVDDNHLDRLGFRAEEENTWLWGLKRMLLGYATDHSLDNNKLLPYPHIHGLDALLLGQLTHFVVMLNRWRHHLATARTLSEWQPLLLELWQDFFDESDASLMRLNYLLDEWNRIITQGIEAGYDEPIPIALLVPLLEEAINEVRPEQNFIEGRVTFCSLIPMRSIPFKIVAIIGLSQEEFPKVTHYTDFNLMQYQRYPGDRTRQHDDRYLFLEAIISAEKQLYLSYIGRSINDNTDLAPSLLIDELLDTLSHLVDPQSIPNGDLKERLTFYHPMAPYNKRLFKEKSPLQSFQSEWIQECEESFATPIALQFSVKEATLTPHALINFYKNPLNSIIEESLDLSTRQQEVALPLDEEPFTLPKELPAFELNNRLIHELLQLQKEGYPPSIAIEQILAPHYKRSGLLPKFGFEEIAWNELISPPLAMVKRLSELNFGGYRECDIHLPLSIGNITGSIKQSTTPKGEPNPNQIYYDAGRMNERRSITYYLKHLLYNAYQPMTATYLLTLEKESYQEYCYTPITKEESLKRLTEYIDLYQMSFNWPLVPTAYNMLNKRDQNLATEFFTQYPYTLQQGYTQSLSQLLAPLDIELQEQMKKLIEKLSEQLYAPTPKHEYKFLKRLLPVPNHYASFSLLYYFHHVITPATEAVQLASSK